MKNTSIQHKITFFLLAIGLPIVLLYIIVDFTISQSKSRVNLDAKIEAVAEIAASYAQPAMAFMDASEAQNSLKPLKQLEEFESAYLLDNNFNVFTSSGNSLNKSQFQKICTQPKKFETDEYFFKIEQIELDNLPLGYLILQVNKKLLNAERTRAIYRLSISFTIAILLAILVSYLLNNNISKPLKKLVVVTEKIANSSQIQERINSADLGQNEIGKLYSAFNKMLDKIEDTTISKGFFDRIFSEMGEILIVLNPEGDITLANNALLKETGYLLHELKQQSVSKLGLNLDKMKLVDHVRQEIFLLKKDQSKLPVLLTFTTSYNSEKEVENYILAATNIQEQKRQQEQLNAYYSELGKKNLELIDREREVRRNLEKLREVQDKLLVEKEKAEQAFVSKSLFLTTISHELRTPLNAIVGLSNILKMENTDANQTENIDLLKLSSESLLLLINDVLDFSKIEAGKMELKSVPTNLAALCKQTIETHKILIAEKGLALHYHFDSAIQNDVIVDEIKLTQVLKNLLSNATKFTERGKISLEIKLLHSTNYAYTIQFKVTDTGIGIKEKDLQEIFSAFSQLHSKGKYQVGGTGLGLSISQKIIELMDSEIKVESQLSSGSTFYFDLVLTQFQHKTKPTVLPISELTKEQKLEAILAAKPNMHVLLVDDNQVNLIVASRILSNLKFSYTTALNGLEALEKLNEFDTTIVLMDIQMPVMDGLEATAAIRKLSDPNKSKVPIIVLSADVMNEVEQKSRAAGANNYLSKPFSPDELLDVIYHLLVLDETSNN